MYNITKIHVTNIGTNIYKIGCIVFLDIYCAYKRNFIRLSGHFGGQHFEKYYFQLTYELHIVKTCIMGLIICVIRKCPCCQQLWCSVSEPY